MVTQLEVADPPQFMQLLEFFPQSLQLKKGPAHTFAPTGFEKKHLEG
jgi:hypothetical protein